MSLQAQAYRFVLFQLADHFMLGFARTDIFDLVLRLEGLLQRHPSRLAASTSWMACS